MVLEPFNLSGIFVVNFLGLAVGPVGMLLSVPLTIIVKIALEQDHRRAEYRRSA